MEIRDFLIDLEKTSDLNSLQRKRSKVLYRFNCNVGQKITEFSSIKFTEFNGLDKRITMAIRTYLDDLIMNSCVTTKSV